MYDFNRQSRKRKRKMRKSLKADHLLYDEGDADVEGCDADSQEEGEEGDLMDELMKASSTIKYLLIINYKI